MARPVQSLPVIQHWDCHSCGDCCKTYHVRVTDTEKARIEAIDFTTFPELNEVTRTVWDSHLGSHRLNHTPDGACVFLGPENRCHIHAVAGPTAKPMACRIYPFQLVPVGDHWRVGLRYACPSAADNLGRPLTTHLRDLDDYAALLEEDAGGRPTVVPAPPLQAAQLVEWSDLLQFQKTIDKELADDSTPLEYRMRKIVALIHVCKEARFDKVTGNRLREFLDVMIGALTDEVPLDPKGVPHPSWIGRMIFRQIVAIYCRKDTGPTPGIARRSRWTRIWSAWRFARGTGPVPRLHGQMPETTFHHAEQPTGPVSPEADAFLTRYYRVKVQALQFCGAANFQEPFWRGLESLILTLPATLWLARILSTPDRTPTEAVKLALRIVDDNFGFNALLGTSRQHWAMGVLSDRGELSKLIAWYSR